MRKGSVYAKGRRQGKEQLPQLSNRCLQEYFPIVRKKDLKEEKLLQKEQQRKQQNQQLITVWLFKNIPKLNQNHLLLKIDKPVILMIFQYLTLTDSARLSQVCRYFNRCYNSIWLNFDYFEYFNLSNFKPVELRKVMEKSTRLTHIRQMKRLFMGKNLETFAEKIRLKAVASHQKGLFDSFEIQPKRSNAAVYLMDENLTEICTHSTASLKTISLMSCFFLTGRSLQLIAKCKKLKSLTLTRNNFIEDTHIELIVKNCKQLSSVNLSGCGSLSQVSIRHLSHLPLQSLDLSFFQTSMGTLPCLCSLPFLHLNLSSCYVNDFQLISLLKSNQVQSLNVSGCPYLTKQLAEFLAHSNLTNLRKLNVMRLGWGEEELVGVAGSAGLAVLCGEAVTQRVLRRLQDNRQAEVNTNK